MPIATVDTMGVADRLRSDVNVSEKQARGLHDNIVGNVATKDDLATVRKDSRNLEGKLTERRDQVEDRLSAQMSRQLLFAILFTVGMMFVMTRLPI